MPKRITIPPQVAELGAGAVALYRRGDRSMRRILLMYANSDESHRRYIREIMEDEHARRCVEGR